MTRQRMLLREYNAFDYKVLSTKQIREVLDPNVPLTTTGPSGRRDALMLKGIIQRAEVVNNNGRIYPRALLEQELAKYQQLIKENRAYGELDHPDTSVVRLKYASHIVRRAWMEPDGTVWGVIEILPTKMGDIVRTLVESNMSIGISSRGVGALTPQGEYDIVEDYQLICWDIVASASTPNAYMRPDPTPVREGVNESLEMTPREIDAVDAVIAAIRRW